MIRKNYKEFLNAIVEGKTAVVADLCINNPAFFHGREGLKCQALSLAAGYGQNSILKTLLKHGFEGQVADRNNWPLRWAVENGHFDVINILLDYQAVRKNIATMDYLPLVLAASQQFNEIAYVIADKCWGSTKCIPHDLKAHCQWQIIIHAIKQGAIHELKKSIKIIGLEEDETKGGAESVTPTAQVTNKKNQEQILRDMMNNWWGDGLRLNFQEMITFFSKRLESEDYVSSYLYHLEEYALKSKL